MSDFGLGIDENQLRMDEITVALKKCKESGYALEPVKHAATLVLELRERVTSDEDKAALDQLYLKKCIRTYVML